MKSKKGKISTTVINSAVLVLVLLTVLFQVYANMMPTAQEAGNELNDSNRCEDAGCYYNDSRTVVCTLSNVTGEDTTVCADTAAVNGIPFASLFSGTGIVFLIIMAALIVLVVKNTLSTK